MSQHLAGSPPAVWNLAPDLKWINESLKDSCPVWHHSLLEQYRYILGARWLKEKKKRVMGGEKTEGWREQRRWRCFKLKLKRLCKSEKQVSCWSAAAAHTWCSLMLWTRTRHKQIRNHITIIISNKYLLNTAASVTSMRSWELSKFLSFASDKDENNLFCKYFTLKWLIN